LFDTQNLSDFPSAFNVIRVFITESNKDDLIIDQLICTAGCFSRFSIRLF